MRRFLLLLACVVVACCMATARVSAATHVVRVLNYYFTPTNITISPGDTVVWRNDSPRPHDSTHRNFESPLWSGFIQNFGDTFEFTFNEAGEYPYVCTRHFFDVAPQQTGTVIVAQANLPPSVRITSPSDGAFLMPSASFTFSADASESVSSVEFFVNGTSIGLLAGRPFSTNVSGLGIGNYLLMVIATDNQGATATNAVNIVVQQDAPTEFALSVTVNPTNTGTVLVTPAPNTNGQYFAGTTVALAAQPNAGFRFTHWSGTALSANPLILVMTNDMSVTANFEAIPSLDFAQAIGVYAGLLLDERETNYTTSGFFRVRVSKSGAYRGTATIGGMRESIAGQFDRFGYAPLVVRRASLSGSLQIESADGRMRGLLTDYKNPNPTNRRFPALLLYRATARTNASAVAGDYTMMFDARDPVTNPGAASMQILPNGSVRLRGMLGDGTALSERTFLSPDGRIPLFVPLYHNRGVILGWLDVAEDGTVQGTVQWFRPADSRSVPYPAGFALKIPVAGSRAE